jgi:hypothetical protein
MMKFILSLVITCLALASAQATEVGVVGRGMAESDWSIYRFHIKWGIETSTEQVWDGHAELSDGAILNVQPFLRFEILYDSMITGPTSWRSRTWGDVEGIYISVAAPPDARIDIFTETYDFSFDVDELEVGEVKTELDGDIEITNVTEEVLFRIAGLEHGEAGRGTATIEPHVAHANTAGTWTLTYTAPEGGIPVGGGIRVSWHFTRSWGEPQFDDPEAPNYVTVATTGRSRLDHTTPHQGLFEYPYGRGRILVRVLDEPLAEGEQIAVTLGDTSEGSPGLTAPWIAEDALSIRVEDCTEVADGVFPVYRRLLELPTVNVLPEDTPHRLFVAAPSEVLVGESFDVRLVVEDRFRNVVPSFGGHLEVLANGEHVRDVNIMPSDRGMITIPDVTLSSHGPWWITVHERTSALSGESNPIRCVEEAPTHRMVWGELHGHTQYSDGYGSGDDYFAFARDRALLDFAAITDHDVELDAPDYHVAEMWEEVNEAVHRNNDPPRFVTIPAYEWSPARVSLSTIEPFGDHNIYYEHEGMPLHMAEHPNSNTLPKIYEIMEALQHQTTVQMIPHVGGAIGNWEYHHPGLENLGEIFSVHGGFGEIALSHGHTVGFVGAADSHNGQVGGFPPGNALGHFTHGGLTAARVGERSRKSLLESFQERNVYATSGPRIWIDFAIDGQPMGSVLESDHTPTIRAEVIGTAPLLTVDLIKNGQVIHTWENDYADDLNLTLLWGNRVEREDLLNFDAGLWSGRLRSVDWSGRVRTSGWGTGFSLREACSFDLPRDSVTELAKRNIEWDSFTRGDWDGVALELARERMNLHLDLGEHRERIDTGDLEPGVTTRSLGDSDDLLIIKGSPVSRHATFEIADQSLLYRWNYYCLKVLQADGEMAWSSPIWIARPEP